MHSFVDTCIRYTSRPVEEFIHYQSLIWGFSKASEPKGPQQNLSLPPLVQETLLSWYARVWNGPINDIYLFETLSKPRNESQPSTHEELFLHEVNGVFSGPALLVQNLMGTFSCSVLYVHVCKHNTLLVQSGKTCLFITTLQKVTNSKRWGNYWCSTIQLLSPSIQNGYRHTVCCVMY